MTRFYVIGNHEMLLHCAQINPQEAILNIVSHMTCR